MQVTASWCQGVSVFVFGNFAINISKSLSIVGSENNWVLTAFAKENNENERNGHSLPLT